MNNGRWLIVVDHQRVFADPGSDWGSPMFAATVPVVAELAAEHGDRVVTTRWVPATGAERIGSWIDYFTTYSFADRPADDAMFDLVPSAAALSGRILTRPTFGKWGAELESITGPGPDLTLVGVSTDCCVISTALAAADGGARVRVVAAGCAGSSPEAHEHALAVMRLYAPQIEVVCPGPGYRDSMPVVESSTVVPVDPATAFAVSQTTGHTRLRWDPFIRRQHFLDGATAPGKGVRTYTRHRSGMSMVSEYVSYAPPSNVGMRMVTGPWFFTHLAGGWRFTPAEAGGAIATWKYSFACRPAWLAPIAERLGAWILQRDIDRRIAGFARGCADPLVLAEVRPDA